MSENLSTHPGRTPPLILATGNAHKIGEFGAILASLEVPLRLQALPAGKVPPPVVEDGDSLEANALLKARAWKELAPPAAWILADDSGLFVDALGGAPGVHSARFAGEPCCDSANNNLLLQRLRQVPLEARTAEFRCCLALVRDDGRSHIFHGSCRGHIRKRLSSASGGFGYDPLFQPHGEKSTFAALPVGRKNEISHRARALQAFAKYCFSLEFPRIQQH